MRDYVEKINYEIEEITDTGILLAKKKIMLNNSIHDNNPEKKIILSSDTYELYNGLFFEKYSTGIYLAK